MPAPILLAQRGDIECHLLPGLANRHGLITGATGTGKTITLQTLAENFSKLGVPVFMADVKGDLTGITQTGTVSEKLSKILQERGLEVPEATTARQRCGMYLRSRGIRCARRCRIWAHCCSAACWR